MIIDTRAKINIEAVLGFLNTHWKGSKACSVCANNHWNVNTELAELRFLSVGGFKVGGPLVPLVVVTCNVCGNTLLFNAMRLGWTGPEQTVPSASGGSQ